MSLNLKIFGVLKIFFYSGRPAKWTTVDYRVPLTGSEAVTVIRPTWLKDYL